MVPGKAAQGPQGSSKAENEMRPKTEVERAMAGEIDWDALPERAPHCDPRVLHKPEECKFCADATLLQAEREKLEISNTGHANRKWPCPGDRERGSKSINGWYGNQAKTQEQLDADWEEWRKQLAELASED